ncbi:MAG TPA: sigma-54 dependent transcriptional regulator [Polyangia bacterium]|jgi:DNA-binding NtrC family response regulator
MTEPRAVLVVDDDETFRTVLGVELRHRGYAVTAVATGAAALGAAAASPPGVVLLDLRLPDADGLEVLAQLRAQAADLEVIILTGHGTIDTAIEAIRRGAFDYAAKPCPVDELEIRIQRALERQSLRARNRLLERGLTLPQPSGVFLGRSPAFEDVIRRVDRVAPTDATVLILGETGAGKEVIAKLIHARSGRAARPFVIVECAALQDNLLQSELFGHERGAFTGADRTKPGLFEVAAGGTIFLDEIGEVNQATQVRLLRVLDTSTYRRVGGTVELRADVRILAATNRDTASLVRQGLFREDFYYRLSAFTVQVPPLRERREDLDALVTHVVAQFNERFGVTRRVGRGALDRLRAYPWPGNVRELYHVLESAMIVCDGPEIRPEHLSSALGDPPAPAAAPAPAPAEDAGALLSLKDAERAHIERVLRATRGRRREAAVILGISERALYRKLEEIARRGTA